MNPDWKSIGAILVGVVLIAVAPFGGLLEVGVGFCAILYAIYRIWYVPPRDRTPELSD